MTGQELHAQRHSTLWEMLNDDQRELWDDYARLIEQRDRLLKENLALRKRLTQKGMGS